MNFDPDRDIKIHHDTLRNEISASLNVRFVQKADTKDAEREVALDLLKFIYGDYFDILGDVTESIFDIFRKDVGSRYISEYARLVRTLGDVRASMFNLHEEIQEIRERQKPKLSLIKESSEEIS